MVYQIVTAGVHGRIDRPLPTLKLADDRGRNINRYADRNDSLNEIASRGIA